MENMTLKTEDVFNAKLICWELTFNVYNRLCLSLMLQQSKILNTTPCMHVPNLDFP